MAKSKGKKAKKAKAKKAKKAASKKATAKKAMVKKKSSKKKSAIIGGGNKVIAPPVPGTTIIIRPQGGNVTFTLDGTPVTDVGAGTNYLNPRAFTPIMWAKADVTINGATYQMVNCRRVRANLNVGGVSKLFQFEVVDGTPTWWLGGVEYVPDTNAPGWTDWNDDLTSPLYGGGLDGWVRVQVIGSNPDWADYPASRVEIALV